MIIFLVIFLGLTLYKVKFSNFHEDYIGRGQSGSIKGFFAIIIFFSHVRQYIALSNTFLDFGFSLFLSALGQLIVTLFFFYSGYGIIQSYKAKRDYSKDFFKKRIVKTWLHFALVVLLYLILSFIVKSDYSWFDYAFAWIGWTSIGNSNWFVFVMLALYLITQIAFLLVKKNNPLAVVVIVCVLSCALFFLLYFTGKETWWMDTLFCYVLGMGYACVEKRLTGIMKKSKLCNYGLIVLCGIAFLVSYIFLNQLLPKRVAGNVTAIFFCLFVVLTLTKVKIDNPILRWLGKYSFYIYICQRLPMITLSAIGLSNNAIFLFVSLILTLGISVLFNFLFTKLDKVLFK